MAQPEASRCSPDKKKIQKAKNRVVIKYDVKPPKKMDNPSVVQLLLKNYPEI